MAKQTLHTIAAALGISHVTVSLALSGSPRIAEATRERIRDYATSVGYRPNRAAQALKRQSTKTFGYVLPNVASPFHSCLAEHLYRAAAEAGYLLQMVLSGHDPASEQRAIEECVALPVDGLVVASVQGPGSFIPKETHPLMRMPRSFPLVAMGLSWGRQSGAPLAYGFDHEASFYALTRWMIDKGCRKIYLLLNVCDREFDDCGGLHNAGVEERIAASRQALSEAGLPWNAARSVLIVHPFERFHVRPGPGAVSDLREVGDAERALAVATLEPILGEIAKAEDGPVGLLAMNDEIAAVAQQECVQRGLEPGKRVFIAGCDDTLAPWMGFTSYRWDYPLFARKAVQGLLAQLNGEPRPASEAIGGRVMARG